MRESRNPNTKRRLAVLVSFVGFAFGGISTGLRLPPRDGKYCETWCRGDGEMGRLRDCGGRQTKKRSAELRSFVACLGLCCLATVGQLMDTKSARRCVEGEGASRALRRRAGSRVPRSGVGRTGSVLVHRPMLSNPPLLPVLSGYFPGGKLLFPRHERTEQGRHSGEHRARVVEQVCCGETLIEKLLGDLRGEHGVGVARFFQ